MSFRQPFLSFSFDHCLSLVALSSLSSLSSPSLAGSLTRWLADSVTCSFSHPLSHHIAAVHKSGESTKGGYRVQVQWSIPLRFRNHGASVPSPSARNRKMPPVLACVSKLTMPVFDLWTTCPFVNLFYHSRSIIVSLSSLSRLSHLSHLPPLLAR